MGTGCGRMGYDLFNKYCFPTVMRDWKQWLFNYKHYFWKDTFGRFVRPFCSHKDKVLYNDDGKNDYYCPWCNSWIREEV